MTPFRWMRLSVQRLFHLQAVCKIPGCEICWFIHRLKPMCHNGCELCSEEIAADMRAMANPQLARARVVKERA